ncbi:MAG TPA: PQQ-binding-like beta-propeller repeat protein [Candidatus Angelobacter sp.]|nr:PQQ-binding-like beta-propeller repeat protein [Candidatus Angelobacter sp.]
MRRRLPFACAVSALALAALSAGAPAVHAATQPNLWPTYHADNTHGGEDTADGAMGGVSRAWASAPLDGKLYAQPIVDGGTVIVATENDTVYGIDAVHGGTLWSTHVGTPITSGLPCGDVNPLGITGTPVLDPASHTVFAAAERVAAGGGVEHVLVAIDDGTGNLLGTRVIDPPGMTTSAQQQRGALLISNGTVYVPFGGLYGDCSSYYGWVIGSQESLGGGLSWWQSPGTRSGVWEPAGVSADAGGNLYVATGNANNSSTCDGGNSVFKLNAALQEVGRFADPNCVSDNNNDLDMGSAGAMLLPDGSVFVLGKQKTAYVLSSSNMGQRSSLASCFSAGGDAYSNGTVYAACTDGSGVVALHYDSASGGLSTAWHGPGDANGPPIVAGGYVWVAAWNNSKLYALNPANGAVAQQFATPGMEHFVSPSAAGGRVFLGAGTQLLAFNGQNPWMPGPPPVQGYWTAAADGGVFAYGTAGWFGSKGGQHLNAPVVGMAATPSGRGYWLVASDGGIFTYGDAGWFGSKGGQPLNAPVVGMAATPSGGYRMVASDGGIFDFGPGAAFYGSKGGQPLFAPMVGMTGAPGGGYWLVAADGGVFCYGPGAGYHGSTGGQRLNRPVVGIAPTADGQGYRMTAADGGIFDFGTAQYYGSQGGLPLNAPMVAIAATG